MLELEYYYAILKFVLHKHVFISLNLESFFQPHVT